MTGGRRRRPGLGVVAASAALAALAGCHTTVDSLGYDGADGIVLHPLARLASYPNAFRDLLGKSDEEIAAKIGGAYAQLFHGDPFNQAIYFTAGTDQAYVLDVLHGDVRTEGIGLAMLVSVELDRRDELDRLWTYARETLQVTSGASAGYFTSSCDAAGGATPCLDPFGLQQLTMALLLAHERWGSAGGGIDYGAAVRELLTRMRHKEDENGGVVGGVTDVFDAVAGLPFDQPDVSSANRSRPSIAMPAYYALWGQATEDPFWARAADSARAYWRRATDGTTGLTPVRARFDGTPVAGGDTFSSESFRTELNLMLDRIWTGGDDWEVATAEQLVGFFTTQGIDDYGSAFSLDGRTVLDPTHDTALVAANGAAALVATAPQRIPFVDAVWNMPVPAGLPRYYSGLLYLVSLLALGGQLQVL